MPQRQPFGQIVLDQQDWKRFQAALRHSSDSLLPKRIGSANEEIGRKFINEWLHPKPDPAAVGAGAGAKVRPSASKREVQLRVGGAHRAGRTPMARWGKRVIRPFEPAPPRPYIKGSAERHRDEIQDAWLKAISEAMDPAFYKEFPPS